MEVIHMNSERPESQNPAPQESDVQEIVAFGQSRGWHVLVLAGTPAPANKGLLIAQPGRPQGILKVLVDVEPEETAG